MDNIARADTDTSCPEYGTSAEAPFADQSAPINPLEDSKNHESSGLKSPNGFQHVNNDDDSSNGTSELDSLLKSPGNYGSTAVERDVSVSRPKAKSGRLVARLTLEHLCDPQEPQTQDTKMSRHVAAHGGQGIVGHEDSSNGTSDLDSLLKSSGNCNLTHDGSAGTSSGPSKQIGRPRIVPRCTMDYLSDPLDDCESQLSPAVLCSPNVSRVVAGFADGPLDISDVDELFHRSDMSPSEPIGDGYDSLSNTSTHLVDKMIADEDAERDKAEGGRQSLPPDAIIAEAEAVLGHYTEDEEPTHPFMLNPDDPKPIYDAPPTILLPRLDDDTPAHEDATSPESSEEEDSDEDEDAGSLVFRVIDPDGERKTNATSPTSLATKHAEEVEALEEEVREYERKYAFLQQDYQNVLEELDNIKACSAGPQTTSNKSLKNLCGFTRSTNPVRRIRLHGDALVRFPRNEIRSRAKVAAHLYILLSQPHLFFFAFCAIYGILEGQYVDLVLWIVLVGQSAVIQYLVHPHWRRKRSPKPEFVERITDKGGFVREDTRNLFAGVVITIEQGQTVPADCLLLRAYGDRIQLDVSEAQGHSKFSEKLPVEETKTCGPAELAALQGALVVDAPNASMTFSGTFRREGVPRRTRLTMENLALTGSVLVAPTAAYFVVVYAGPDTKVALNTKYRRPTSISTQILQQAFIILLSIAIALALITNNAQNNYDVGLANNAQNNYNFGFEDFIYGLYCFRHICPIGLFISVDFARLAQGKGSAIYAYGDLGRVSTVVVGSGLITTKAETLTMSLVGDKKYGFLTFEDLEPFFDKYELENLESRLAAVSSQNSTFPARPSKALPTSPCSPTDSPTPSASSTPRSSARPSYFSRPIFQSARAQGIIVDQLLEQGKIIWTNECLAEQRTGKRVLAAGWRQSTQLAQMLEGSVHPRLLTFSMQRKERVTQILQSLPNYLSSGLLTEHGGGGNSLTLMMGGRGGTAAGGAGTNDGQAYRGALKKSRTQVLKRSRTAIIKKLGNDSKLSSNSTQAKALGTADPYYVQLRPFGMFDMLRMKDKLFVDGDDEHSQALQFSHFMRIAHGRVFIEQDFVEDLCGQRNTEASSSTSTALSHSNADYCFAMVKANICCLTDVQMSNTAESFRKFTVSTTTPSSDHAVISALNRFGISIVQWTKRHVACQFTPGMYNERFLPPKDSEGRVCWEIVGVNPLNERQRRSVVILDVDGYVLLCKGSVSALMPRIREKSDVEHLRRMYRLFAHEGCRTEVVARRYLDDQEAQQYKEQLEAAQSSLIDTRYETNDLFEKMESNLECIGMNAFEDVLVPGVENTLQTLLDGGLRIWILSGDAADRTLRIAQQIKLLPTDATLFSVLSAPQGSQSEVHSRHAFKQTYCQFSGVLSNLHKNKSMGSCAVVFDGPSLSMVLKDPQLTAMFMHMILMVESCVLGCQLTPAQKAEICTIIREKSECSILPGIGIGSAASSPFFLGVGNSLHEKEMLKATNVSVETTYKLDASFQIPSFHALEQLIFQEGRLHFRTLAFIVRFYLCVALSVVGAMVIRQSALAFPNSWIWFPCMHILPVLAICVFGPTDVPKQLPLLFPALHVGNMGNLLFSYDMTIENCVVGFVAGLLAQFSCEQSSSLLPANTGQADHAVLVNLHLFALLLLFADLPTRILPMLICGAHIPIVMLPIAGRELPIAGRELRLIVVSTLIFVLWAVLALVIRFVLTYRHLRPEWLIVAWWSRMYPRIARSLSEVVDSRSSAISNTNGSHDARITGLPSLTERDSFTDLLNIAHHVCVPLTIRYRQGLNLSEWRSNIDLLNPIGPERTYSTAMPRALSVAFTAYAMGHIVQMPYVIGQILFWAVWLLVLIPNAAFMSVFWIIVPLLSLPCWLLPDMVVDRAPSLFTFAVAITWVVPLIGINFSNDVPREVVSALALFVTFASPFILRLMSPFHAIVPLAVCIFAIVDGAYDFAVAVAIVLLETSFVAHVLLRHMRTRFLSQKIAGEEAERTKKSLHNMLPSHVVEGLLVKGQTFQDFTAAKPDVAVLFCKIDDFARWVQLCKPVELVTALDRLFAGFDSSCENRKASKVESASEVYFAVAGMEDETALSAAESVNRMLDVALDLLYVSTKIHLYLRGNKLDGVKLPGEALEDSSLAGLGNSASRGGGRRTFLLKIGINVGEVICGVVGSKKPQYSLYGDTVNTSARMAQMCDPDGNVQATEEARDAIGDDPKYTWRETYVEAKGKGRVRCFLLESAKGIELISSNTPSRSPSKGPPAAVPVGSRRTTLSALNQGMTQGAQKRRLSFSLLQQEPAATPASRRSPAPPDTPNSNRAALASLARDTDRDQQPSPFANPVSPSPAPSPSPNRQKTCHAKCTGSRPDSPESPTARGGQMLAPPKANLRCRRPSIKLNVDDGTDDADVATGSTNITFAAMKVEENQNGVAYDALERSSDSQLNIKGTLKFADTAQELKFRNTTLLEPRHVTRSLAVTTLGFVLLLAHSHFTNFVLLAFSALLFIATYFQRWLPKSEIVPDFLLVLVAVLGGKAALDRDYAILTAWAGLLICNRAVLMTSQCCALACLESLTLGTMIYYEEDSALIVCSMGIFCCLFYSAWLNEWWARTSFIENERVRELGLRATQLLDEMMPQEILRQLKDDSAASVSTTRIAYDYNHCVLLFSDICGFTAYSSKTSPDKVVEMLSALFVHYDRLTTELELYKLCTIGDAYVCLTEPKVKTTEAVAALEAERVIWMAELMHRHLRSVAEALSIAYLNMRIGLHIGHLLGGVLGRSKLRFDVFGETVLIAAHMEQAGEPGQINVSSHLKRFLLNHYPEDRFHFHFNKDVSIMGKTIASYRLTDLKE
eukprot:GEMP01000122.1.p1 GENE.GEMP01000122.1~~GEMP01000122.1.p1  ORF type:complete len:2852 (+),score=577.61 GEMP01000122.1:236-8791(+)